MTFRPTLEHFTVECEAAGMKFSSSKSKAMVLNWKKMKCSLHIRNESLPQAEEFKYLEVLFTSDTKLDHCFVTL